MIDWLLFRVVLAVLCVVLFICKMSFCFCFEFVFVCLHSVCQCFVDFLWLVCNLFLIITILSVLLPSSLSFLLLLDLLCYSFSFLGIDFQLFVFCFLVKIWQCFLRSQCNVFNGYLNYKYISLWICCVCGYMYSFFLIILYDTP